MRAWFGLPMILMVMLLAGCASGPKVSEQHSGFFSDYSRLKPLAAQEKSQFLGYHARRWKMRRYESVIIEPVIVHINDEVRKNWQVQPERYHQLQAYFTERLTERLKLKYTITDQPGPNTLRLRVAITGGELGMKALEFYQFLPWGLVINGVGELAGVRDKLLNIIEEGELVDSLTGEQVVALVGGVQYGPVDMGDFRKSSADELKPVIDVWVDSFYEHLR